MGGDDKLNKTISRDMETKNGTNNLTKLIIPDSTQKYQVQPVQQINPAKKKKKKRRDKSDVGDNFVAPDGGWGWLVAIASGVNILVTFAMAQQFGIIFRQHMNNLGISSSQLTTIINTQVAVSAITGLLNGPLFRRFTYRQVALVGSFLTFIGLFACVFAESFLFYVLSFSICYGFGRGLTVSASSLAVNTFFKERRRTATAYQFGVAGLGPIVLPYLATFLLQSFGVRHTVLCFAGLSLNTIACSLVYQPVRWHVKKKENDPESSKKLTSLDDDDDIITHPVEPETPVLPRANDGWFGSKTSLNNLSYRNRLSTWEKQQQDQKLSANGEQGVELKRLNSHNNNNDGGSKVRSFSLSHSIKEEGDYEHENGDHYNQQMQHKPDDNLKKPPKDEDEDDEEEARKKMSFLMKIVVFFDLDLLRDITYLNLAMGLTLINFVEINFAILTPFILSDFGFDSAQIAMAMSLLGFCDLVVRFLVPLITAKINLSNEAFFGIGIMGMCIGRFILSCTTNFYVMIGSFAWMGLNKAFRTVFWSLIIPGYVPLKRLPAAAGLQLLLSGLFSMACGPLIGLIRDQTSYAFTLNFLNMLCVVALSLWLLESLIRKYRTKSKPVTDEPN
ncbi:monocarboxylate transporter 9 [Stomoxys calcitrans]|uniref:monocarboxylate transporter 9 n=1 Tax=Stomoxys calcitrans TaxID=35570 RepID=UPI0027E34C11|nr:monocarboxylate transporter 9 [Stomoxys calcitrans]XP_013118793.2 monocarboxylate transporter 9 [Stomoxys calcitrans]